MKILLVKPNTDKRSLGVHDFVICEPLELEYIAGYLKEDDRHTINIIDMFIETKPFEYFVEKYKPDLVAFTAYITQVNIVKKYAKVVKHLYKNTVTVVGGVHAEVNPHHFEDENIDFIIKVNGLKTFREIVNNIESGFLKNKEEISGVWTCPDKEYKIDTNFKFPLPDRKITQKYRKKYNYMFVEQCALLKTSFGCPYNCDFCYCVQITQNQYFTRDLDEVIEEIKTIKEENIFIVDDNFLVNRERILKFCGLLDDNKIKKNFVIFGRSDFISNNEDIIRELRNHGVFAIFIGIESFKEEHLLKLNKRETAEANEKALRILRKYNIDCFAGIILDLDYEKKDFDYLIQHLKPHRIPLLIVQSVIPIPGTSFYNKVKDEIIVTKDEYELWDMAHLLLRPTKLTNREFYYQILRVYLETSLGIKNQVYFIKKYGIKAYLRALKGTTYFLFQYFKIILRGQ